MILFSAFTSTALNRRKYILLVLFKILTQVLIHRIIKITIHLLVQRSDFFSHISPNYIQSSIHNNIIGPEDINTNIIDYKSVDLINNPRFPVQFECFYFLTFRQNIFILTSNNVILLELWLMCNDIPDFIDISFIFVLYFLHSILGLILRQGLCCYFGIFIVWSMTKVLLELVYL